MKAQDISVNEWLDALKSVNARKNDAGMTAVELSELWGVCLKTTNDRIRALHRRGLVKAGQREGVSIIGRRILTPVYTITRAKK